MRRFAGGAEVAAPLRWPAAHNAPLCMTAPQVGASGDTAAAAPAGCAALGGRGGGSGDHAHVERRRRSWSSSSSPGRHGGAVRQPLRQPLRSACAHRWCSSQCVFLQHTFHSAQAARAGRPTSAPGPPPSSCAPPTRWRAAACWCPTPQAGVPAAAGAALAAGAARAGADVPSHVQAAAAPGSALSRMFAKRPTFRPPSFRAPSFDVSALRRSFSSPAFARRQRRSGPPAARADGANGQRRPACLRTR